jgi:hypothetical protein
MHSKPWQRTSKQRGSELGNRLFSGPLWSEGTEMHGIAAQGIAAHVKATRIAHWEQRAFQVVLTHPAGYPQPLY